VTFYELHVSEHTLTLYFYNQRPYEISGNGQGKEFKNNFVLLALRNSSLKNGTLETLQSVFNPSQLSDLSDKTTPSIMTSKESSTDPSLHTPDVPQELEQGHTALAKRTKSRRLRDHDGAATPGSAPDEEPVDIYDRLDFIKRQKKLERMKARDNDESTKRKPSDVGHDSDPLEKRTRTEERRSTPTQRLTPASPGSAALSPITKEYTPSANRPSTDNQRPNLTDIENSVTPSLSRHQSTVVIGSTIPCRLAEDEAKHVRVIWTMVIEDDIECDFEHGLDECQSFSDLLNLFREDAKFDTQATATLTNTKLWRMMYQLPGHAKKAFNVRPGNEVAFERFQETLAQSSIWKDNPDIRFDVLLKALS